MLSGVILVAQQRRNLMSRHKRMVGKVSYGTCELVLGEETQHALHRHFTGQPMTPRQIECVANVKKMLDDGAEIRKYDQQQQDAP